ncbi:MAG: WhiB family transcriptional regulator [Acidimicrobiia bacterium]|nr:WhiB family transcriptional regulator [Acidimicrobiia bacterium]
MLGIDLITISDEAWRLEARCQTDEPGLSDVFFSEEIRDIARAKSICAECPVMAQCLEGAMARQEPFGVWGGQLFSNGRVLRQKRRRGRPPKKPRPEDQLPHIPVPEHLEQLLRTA